AWPTPLDRNLFVTDFSGKKTYRLTEGNAWHRAVLNDEFTQFYDFRSDLNTPQSVHLYNISIDKKKNITAKLDKTVNENNKLKEKISEYGYGKA
ncbi:hypothetical protein P7A58_15690, partial [Clostridium perfringens]|nr:hypothetical protein [Clostridium perfringens]